MALQDEDTVSNPSNNPTLSDIAEIDLSRRRAMQGGLAAAMAAAFGLPAFTWAREAQIVPSAGLGGGGGPLLGFGGVAVSTDDLVRVPAGYEVQVLYAWGDPISNGPAFAPDASNSAEDQAIQAGMHHDGIHFFPFPKLGSGLSSTHGLLCINNEYTDDGLLHVGGMDPWTAEKVRKSQNAHGVSIVEVRLEQGAWHVVRPSRWARRITGNTPIKVVGPAAGHDLLKTAADTEGRRVLGTLNNCAHGRTPWGTYLTCEENWNGYFSKETGTPTTDEARYGINKGGFGYRWHEHDERFLADLHPNEPNRFGWVVEIDPFNPRRIPEKKTALGRFKHEGAMVTLANDGRVVVYMGDDERNEYLYKFVSKNKYKPGLRHANLGLLNEGTLYVAKFEAGAAEGDQQGTGQWLPLIHGKLGLTAENGFNSQAEVLVKTRQAADRVGATMMDRPEWIAVHPETGEVYVTLTNNNRRGSSPASSNKVDGTTTAGSARPPVDEANPRASNVFGHIVRWREAGGNAAATHFEWDVFVLAGDSANADPSKQGNVNGDDFGSPDGLWFDRDGRLWIQTDVSTSTLNKGDYANLGNNQMLVADPATREIRRFLTGPKGCEITGVVGTPDGTSLFVNVQHPGEPASERSDPANPEGVSSWPHSQGYGPKGRPRSATIVIRRADGGVVGGA
ncbi:MAG: PhoX family phosphatase [Pseudomonadota bacterium]